eukprot:GHVH01014757.1.p1 GENE.GHVH01014757.1~~GHVH01014757.1.p1  ORF type:complete len:126 (-),score=12.22 GHVH01014757.1:1753-2130(-)
MFFQLYFCDYTDIKISSKKFETPKCQYNHNFSTRAFEKLGMGMGIDDDILPRWRHQNIKINNFDIISIRLVDAVCCYDRWKSPPQGLAASISVCVNAIPKKLCICFDESIIDHNFESWSLLRHGV